MKKTEFNQGVSFKVYSQAHVRADGLNAVYLRVIIDRKKREFNLKVYWPIMFFDQEKQIVKTRYLKDADADAINMVINEAKGRANRIKLRYFTDGKTLTLDSFAREFENYDSRDNFLKYWENKREENLTNGKINESTYTRHGTNLRRFKDFLNEYVFFSMGELTHQLVTKYHQWLRKKVVNNKNDNPAKMQHNTTINALKCLQTYINHVREDGFRIDDAFNKITLRYQTGERAVLDREEIKALQKVFTDEKISETMREVLRKFLFSCFTGYAYETVYNLEPANIFKGLDV